MVVENYSHCDALDMTWVRYLATLGAAKKFLKIQRNDPLTQADDIERQQQKEHTGLIPPWMAPQPRQAKQSPWKSTAPAFTGPQSTPSAKSAEESRTLSTSV